MMGLIVGLFFLSSLEFKMFWLACMLVSLYRNVVTAEELAARKTRMPPTRPSPRWKAAPRRSPATDCWTWSRVGALEDRNEKNGGRPEGAAVAQVLQPRATAHQHHRDTSAVDVLSGLLAQRGARRCPRGPPAASASGRVASPRQPVTRRSR